MQECEVISARALRKLIRDDPEESAHVASRLRERGVECAIVIPMLEVVMGFDGVSDIEYQSQSTKKNDQVFDFLIDGKFLVEAKALNVQLGKHYKQIETYIRDNDNINYGLLTNGIVYQIWIQRSFIQTVSRQTLRELPSVIKVFDLSLEDESVDSPVDFALDVLALFSKCTFEDSFSKIARVAANYAIGGKGRRGTIHRDRQVNAELKQRIQQAVTVEQGVLYEQVFAGEIQPGDELEYRDECVSIRVEVTKTGTVILRKGNANILDFVGAMKGGWTELSSCINTEWMKEDTEFQDPIEIIRLARGLQVVKPRKKYQFNRV